MVNRRKPLVVVTRKLPDHVETRMRELFDTNLNENDKPMDRAELIDAMRTAEILVPTVTDRIDAAVLTQAGEQLRLIANFGNGVDHIDVTAALQRGITVTNTPGVLTEDTADMTMALILAVPRRLAGGGPSGCRSITTTGAGWRPSSKHRSRRPIGRASIRCWRGWTSFRSIVPTPRRPIICCRRVGSS